MNSGSVYEPLMGGSFFVRNGEGIEVLAEPIFVRAQPFNGSGPAAPFNGWHAPCLAGEPCARRAKRGVFARCRV